MISSVTTLANTTATSTTTSKAKGYDDLGQADFFRLLTVQMEQQDPFNPVDNTQMLAQMAQFSSLSGINDVNSTLEAMSGKLDKLIDSGTPATTTETSPAKEA